MAEGPGRTIKKNFEAVPSHRQERKEAEVDSQTRRLAVVDPLHW